MIDLKTIREADPELCQAYVAELERQRGNIELIASENFVSPAVMAAMGSHFTNKYAEGYPGKRYYGGCQFIDQAEELARKRACQLFCAEHANVQPHSGANANLAVFYAFLNPGDTVLGMNLSHGGHLSHGSPVNISGRYFNVVPYGVDETTCTIDYEQVRQIALQCKPKLIIAGASAYPREIDFEKFRQIADEVGAVLMVDMAHIAGLVAAGLHQNPVPFADVVTSTTHKTLRGPRGGLILCKQQWAKKIDSAVFPGTQGGPLEHVIAAKAVCFKEALSQEFAAYQRQVAENARALAQSLLQNGLKLVSGGTDNHLVLVDLSEESVTGKELETLLDRCRITVNKNSIPFDKRGPTVTSGIRLGTPAVTTRGMKQAEMQTIGAIVADVAHHGEEALQRAANAVQQLTDSFPLYQNDVIY